MSCRSPLTVPSTAVTSGAMPASTSTGSRTAIASFIARAAMSISGTKISFRENRRPTSCMACVIVSSSTCGEVPSSIAPVTRRVALDRSPAPIAADSAARSAITFSSAGPPRAGAIPPVDSQNYH